MKRTAAVIASMVAVTWLAAGAARASPAPCVAITGDPDVAARVRDGLTRRGVRHGGIEECTALRVELAPLDDMIVAEALDAEGRRSRKTVRDASTVAVLIEAWAESGVVADVDPIEPSSVAARAPSEPRHPRSPLELTLGGGVNLSLPEVAPLGALGTCWRFVRQCLGARVSLTPDSESAMAVVEIGLPARRGVGMTIAVGAGLMAVPTGYRMADDPTNPGFGLMSGVIGQLAVSSRMSLELSLTAHMTPSWIGTLVKGGFDKDAADSDPELGHFHEGTLQLASGIRVRLP